MALPAGLLTSDWPDEIAESAREEYRGVVSILNPANTGGVPYNPVTGEGGPGAPSVLIDHRPARIQHIRLPQASDGSAQAGSLRRIRVQFDIVDTDPEITPGLIVRVDDGGRDKSLEQYRFKVTSGINSSSAAVRTIEAITQQVPS